MRLSHVLPRTCRKLTVIEFVIALFLPVYFHVSAAIAQVSNHATSEPVPPVLTVLERPKSSYHLDDVITYRIQVQWPETYSDIRMRPPDIDLFNLKLIGVSQETVSDSQTTLDPHENEQILNFNFRGLEPGPARIEQISLKWSRADGAIGSELRVPGFNLTIRRPVPWRFVLPVPAAIATAGIFFLVFVLKRSFHKHRPGVPPPVFPSIAEVQLDHLRQLYSEWKGSGNNQQFLDRLTRIIERYLAQELDWHFGRDSYNELQLKAQAKWSRKDSLSLGELVKKLEYQKYSGTILDSKELDTLYQNLCTFIERKRIISSA